MYTFKNLAFRPIEKSDLEILRNLHNDPSTFLNLATINQVDEQDQINWWENLHRIKNDERYTICFSDKPELIIGRLRIQNIDLQNKNCEIGLDILPEYRGEGYGLLSYQMILEYLFLHKNFNMVYVRVTDYNSKAKSLYEKAGFTQTGVYKDYIYRHGKYWDYIILCMTRNEYFKNR